MNTKKKSMNKSLTYTLISANYTKGVYEIYNKDISY